MNKPRETNRGNGVNKWGKYKNRCDSMLCGDLPRIFLGASKTLRMFIPNLLANYIVSLNVWIGRAFEWVPAKMQLTNQNKRNKMNLRRARLLIS